MEINLFEIILIIILSIFQSIFGVGLLIFGTPILLIFEKDFFEILSILIPVSMTISFLQIFKHDMSFKIEFIKLFNFVTLPFLLITLIILVNYHHNLNINILISILIIFFSILNISFKKKNLKLFKTNVYKYSIFILIGIIHGLTNLGGSLLSLASTQINEKKNLIRVCIAYGYFFMGFLQLVTINLFSSVEFNFSKIYLILIPCLVYQFSQKFYLDLSSMKFNIMLNVITLIFGIYIFIKFIFFS